MANAKTCCTASTAALLVGPLAAWRTRLGRKRRNGPSFHVRELGEALAPQRLTQLQQAARLDLADALARDAVGAGHLFQRLRVAVLQPEAQLDHLALARRQRPQHLADALAQQVLVHRDAGVRRVRVVEEVLQRTL